MKKRGLTRSIALIIMMTMMVSLALAGCGAEKVPAASTSSASAQPSESASAQPSESAPAATGLTGDFEVQIFVGGYGDVWWKEMLAGFKKENPQLNIIENMGPKVNEQMKTRWVSDNPPDFVYVDGAEGISSAHAQDGKLLDLKDFFDNTKAPDGKSIREHILDGMIPQINGGEYFAPFIFNAMALFYDDKILKDNGLSSPQNFEEFLAVGEALKAKNIALINYPGIYPQYLSQGFLHPALVAEGGQQLLEDVMSGKAGTYTSQPFKNAIGKIATMAQKGYVLKGTTALNHTQSQMEWLNRKAAFISNGLWVENEMKNDIPADYVMQYNAAAIRSSGQKVSLVGSGVNNAIAANAKNKEAALAFMAYLYREDSIKRLVEILGVPTCYVMDTSKIEIKSQMVKSCLQVLADPEVQIVAPQVNWVPEIQKIMDDQINSIVLGDMTVDQYCENVEKEAARVLAQKK